MKTFRITTISVMFLLVTLTFPMFADPGDIYYVIRVRGTVQFRGSDNPLKRGDQLREIRDNSRIIFRPSDANAILIHPKKGRFVLRPDYQDKVMKKSELVCFLKYCLLSSQGRISTRSAINEKEMRAEIALMISALRSHNVKEEEIQKQALGYLTDVYYDKNNIAKAERWLKQNFYRGER